MWNRDSTGTAFKLLFIATCSYSAAKAVSKGENTIGIFISRSVYLPSLDSDMSGTIDL